MIDPMQVRDPATFGPQTALEPGSVVRAVRTVSSYLADRFPLHTIGVAVLLTYAGSFLVYGNAADATAISAISARGAATLLLLFLALRIVDDIDDNQPDIELGRVDREAVAAHRRSLIAGFVAVALGVLALNVGTSALVPALSALLGMLVAAFVVKAALNRGVTTGEQTSGSAAKDAVIGVVTEGVAFLMISYPYFAWSAATDRTLAATTVLPVVLVFWTSFEVWKMSRYLTRPRWRAYGFSWRGARLFLLTMLALSLASQLRVWAVADLPIAFAVVAVGIPAGLAVWLLRAEPVDGAATKGHLLHHLSGLLFVALVDVSVIVAAATARIGS